VLEFEATDRSRYVVSAFRRLIKFYFFGDDIGIIKKRFALENTVFCDYK
jgi:hypothetical protein